MMMMMMVVVNNDLFVAPPMIRRVQKSRRQQTEDSPTKEVDGGCACCYGRRRRRHRRREYCSSAARWCSSKHTLVSLSLSASRRVMKFITLFYRLTQIFVSTRRVWGRVCVSRVSVACQYNPTDTVFPKKRCLFLKKRHLFFSRP